MKRTTRPVSMPVPSPPVLAASPSGAQWAPRAWSGRRDHLAGPLGFDAAVHMSSK